MTILFSQYFNTPLSIKSVLLDKISVVTVNITFKEFYLNI